MRLSKLTHRLKLLFLSLFVVLWQYAVPCQAKTLADYQVERDQASREADEAQARRAREARARAERMRALRDQKLKEKQDLVASGKSRLEASGVKKFRLLKDELEWMQRQTQLFTRASENYLASQNQLKQRIETWQNQLRSYQNTEAARKSELSQGISLAHLTSSVAELVTPHQRIRDLGMNEGAKASQLVMEVDLLTAELTNGHGRYLLALAPLAEFIKKYQLQKIPSPRVTLDKLAGAKKYIQLRSTFLSDQANQAVRLIEVKMDQLIVDHVDAVMTELEAKDLNLMLSAAFTETMHQLLKKKTEVMERVQVPFGCGQKLKPLYDFYKEALAFKGLCNDLEKLKKSKSIYLTGCSLIEGTLSETQDFMKDAALNQMQITEALARLETDVDLQQLTKQLSKALNQEGTLIKKIHLHDSLIRHWQEILNEAEI